MDFDSWINANDDKLKQIVYNITKNEDADDLLQCVMEQMLQKREYYSSLDDKSKLYLFVRICKNNYFSRTSPYFYQHKKQSLYNIELDDSLQSLSEDESTLQPTLEWVYMQLDTLRWFDRDIFLLWMELGSLKAVSKKTRIPHNSVGRYINKIKKELQRRWIIKLNNL